MKWLWLVTLFSALSAFADGGWVSVAAPEVDGTWNLGLELMASNPNFRDAGVQNAVYQTIVEEWGSPLQRLGAYGNAGERPAVVDGEIVDALWDLGAASTVYRNLGAQEARVYGEDTKIRSLSDGGITT